MLDSDEGYTGSGQDSQLIVDKLCRRTRHVTQKLSETKTKIIEWERMLDNMVEAGLLFLHSECRHSEFFTTGERLK